MLLDPRVELGAAQTQEPRGFGLVVAFSHQALPDQSALNNGELLRRASAEFEVLVTGDQNIEYQQNLVDVSIAVIVLVAKNSRIETLRPLVPNVLVVLASITPGQLIRVTG